MSVIMQFSIFERTTTQPRKNTLDNCAAHSIVGPYTLVYFYGGLDASMHECAYRVYIVSRYSVLFVVVGELLINIINVSPPGPAECPEHLSRRHLALLEEIQARTWQ